ncbi:phage capsid protein [Mogibacterium sp. NSJ-24]|uniref:Phage capsid protein n=1 Tax=Lentihominibacter hominis TaxID=2763645 RepID=A0A926E5K0_9FIRM|nr:phage capsid protein [Lentihominibacter hominis]MBC8568235.1 phage capsid protein [Lentihominibacter hominis]
MFEGIKTFWRALRAMFSTTDIKRIVGGDVALTEELVERIELWDAMLNGRAPWNNRAPSLGIESGICREFADIAINEMEAKVDNENLDKLFRKAIKDLNENLQEGIALGSMIIKPMMGGAVEYVSAKDFIPIKFDADRLVDCVLIERKKLEANKYFFRTERHTLTDQGLRIENKAYFSATAANLGTQTYLTDIPEWAGYPEDITYPGMDKMDFGFYKNPIKNRVDETDCGVSIYSGAAVDRIRKADIQAARYDWEYESGERAIHVDERALRREHNGRVYVDNLDRRLYRGLNIDAEKGDLFKEYSPEMRDEAFNRGLESYYRQIEFIVGLAYGDLSDTQNVDKTATEIRAAKQRKYNRVSAIQENLKNCLEGLVDAIAFYNGLYTTGYSFSCSFNDSILTDEEAERNQDRQEVSMGVMRLDEYRAKWYGEDRETALANLPEQSNPILDNIDMR